jgi:hypothetical protein
MADALEARLTALGRALEFPRLDSLVDDVLAELDDKVDNVDGSDDVDGPGHQRLSRWRRPLLVAAALLLVATTVALAVPASRRTIAGWLGFDALRIERVDVVPPTLTVPPATVPSDRLAQAAAEVGVTPLVAAQLGPPVFVATPSNRYLVVGYDEALLVTLPGTIGPDLFVKSVGPEAEVHTIQLFGAPAYWITGDPHFFMYRDEDGRPREVRPAAASLVWQRGDVIVRIEGDVSMERAIEIAESVHPL